METLMFDWFHLGIIIAIVVWFYMVLQPSHGKLPLRGCHRSPTTNES